MKIYVGDQSWLRRTACWMTLLLLPSLASGQNGSIARFVAPTYPPLARQVMMAGTVGIMLEVGTDGIISDLKVTSSSHPLLVQEAERTVRQWQFHSWSRPRGVAVTFYFALSGETRDREPRVSIKADFDVFTIRVYVTTDAIRVTTVNGQ